MGSRRFSCSLFVMLFMGFLLGLSQGYKFYVGGRDGWVTNPSENYNHWAERNRFQVNDTLFFKYKKGGHADRCNKGQKLIIIVMAVRPKPHPPTPPSPLTPTSPPSPITPTSPSPALPTSSPPGESPNAPSPSDADGPMQPPSNRKSGSQSFSAGSLSAGLVLSASIGVSLILGGFVGLV
ncbi:unnamed protein product [Dovyalis caffra]|uniref:Phytocyanin domain-containing protein n=1 Tax=Dovyalis caffra TaxID=77055 RepID=A0AAV1QM61_9ROSI|nr:unnamed protein product [Dovyalis caffra]